MKKILHYLDHRLEEKSTLAAVVGGIPAAAVLPWPWSAIMFAGAAILALYPTSGGCDDCGK